MVLPLNDFNGHAVKPIVKSECAWRIVEERILLKFRDEKQLCIAST